MVKRSNYRFAEAYYKMALNVKPDMKEAWNNLGRLCTEFLGRPDIGLSYLEEALEPDSTYVSALVNKGIALGTAGAQTASTILKWILPNVDITPFIKAEQALQALILTLASSFFGCIHSSLKSTRTRYMEQPLYSA